MSKFSIGDKVVVSMSGNLMDGKFTGEVGKKAIRNDRYRVRLDPPYVGDDLTVRTVVVHESHMEHAPKGGE